MLGDVLTCREGIVTLTLASQQMGEEKAAYWGWGCLSHCPGQVVSLQAFHFLCQMGHLERQTGTMGREKERNVFSLYKSDL